MTSSATPAVTLSTAQLDAKFDALVATTSTHVAVEIGLTDGTTLYQHESATLFDAASLYKLGIMVEVYQERDVGALTFDDPVTLYPGFFYEDDSVYAVDSSEYTDVSVGELLSLPPSATTSSNSSAGGTYDITSPHKMVQLLEQLLSGTVLSPATSAEMLALLSQQEINDRLPAGVLPGTRVAQITGDLDSLLHDAGVIYAPSGPIVVVVIITDDVENRDDVMGIRFRRLTGRIWMASFRLPTIRVRRSTFMFRAAPMVHRGGRWGVVWWWVLYLISGGGSLFVSPCGGCWRKALCRGRIRPD